MELFGVRVATVHEAHQIVDRIRSEAPDVLLQDVRMPEFDVEAHVRRIRADPELAALPIVIFSAYVDAHEIARRVGADGAIAKPFEPEELMEVLERVARTGDGRGDEGAGGGQGPDQRAPEATDAVGERSS